MDEECRSTQVIIAALNEEPGIAATISELMSCLGAPRVLVVDGSSRDRTVEIAKNMGAEIVCQDGIGKGDAIAKALEHADLGVGFVVFIDADYTYPAENLPRMISILADNPRVGMVCGNRFNDELDVKALHDLFYFGNRLLALAHSMLNGVALRDPLTGLRVVRAAILRGWSVRSKGFDVEVELNRYVEKKGYRIVEIPISYRKRMGEKKLKLRHAFTILSRIVSESLVQA